MHVTRTVGLLAAALSTALVTACAAGAPPAAPPVAPPVVETAAHNAADVAFAQGMIPHHEQAVQMSRLAAQRAGSPQVVELAATIERAQAPEIEQLRGFLAAWGAPEDSSMGGMRHGDAGMPGMPGMMSAGQMAGLGQQPRGAAFDRMFLQMMIEHHEGAVTMARAELSEGADPQAQALAGAIVDAQTAEIARMRALLTTV